MKNNLKIGIGVVITLLLLALVVALAGMYKFNYLANQPGYDVDGNKVDRAEPDILKGDYVGMSVTQAQAKAKAEAVPFRVVMADGEPFAVTMDYRPGRINATVENGVVTSYSVEGAEATQAYDANSWQTEITGSCKSFFDGCNNCRREEGSDLAACTRKACVEYEKPKCLDGQA